ncbi:recombinase family protein [Blastopirellula sp. JC732]|uniref:Recombinase family protein n=1 Tax=Blastopirellula sediminis TaxID=2894196 RepID=A0A9X1SFS1_9BACT|nr:recombinase family protein [Blastopirellula sediminis]MCC9608575.1 recombinase family protein [Blastopirellula sediminis]MCC9628648.1 recombinase family protein [Blastopirellula sediminis]
MVPASIEHASNSDQKPSEKKRAAQYVRMSTEHQQYSTLNQEDIIREYAERRGFEIVRTYADEGKSGLSVAGRDSLRRLIADVQELRADFDVILVYDVSRWGRFQDADESAYYEYLCKRAGIEVHYCAEQFENDGGPTSTIIKSVKRAMAGEYSRELSSKVFKGQCRLIELGFRQGGAPGFGLRRMLIDQGGQSKSILNRGEYKSLQTDRVILVPGPPDEVVVVREIYDLFVRKGKREGEIAGLLNSRGITTDYGRQWNRGTVAQVLTNEKYIGNNVYNRTSFKLKRKHVVNSPEMWVRADGAFEPIVPPDLFFTAQGIAQERNRRFSDDELIERLKLLASRHPTLSAAIIDSADDIPTSSTFRSRFGSLIRAYRLAGYTPERDYRYLEINRHLRELYPDLVADVVQRLDAVGASVTRDATSDLLLINGEYSASMVLSRCRQTPAGALRWWIKFDERIAPDITILVRMDPENEVATDYYLFPLMDLAEPKVLLCETNGAFLDTYQFDNLDYFAQLAARSRIEVAA